MHSELNSGIQGRGRRREFWFDAIEHFQESATSRCFFNWSKEPAGVFPEQGDAMPAAKFDEDQHFFGNFPTLPCLQLAPVANQNS